MAISYSKAANNRKTQHIVQPQENYWYAIVIPAILSVITFLAYWPSRLYEFHFDDKENILKYFAIRHATFRDLFFSSPRWISKWLNTRYYAIGEFSPYAYRLGGISCHIATGILLFALMYRICKYQSSYEPLKKFAVVAATITSTLFLLHPVQTQTVSYVIQSQLEGLSALAMVSLLLIFFSYTRSSEPVEKASWLFCLVTCTLLGCGTKEIFIIAPALVLIVDWFFIAEGSIQKLLNRAWVYVLITFPIIVSFCYFSTLKVFTVTAATYNNFGNAITADGATTIHRGDFLISQFKVILHYIQIFFWPFNISVEYDWKMVQSLFSYDCLIPLSLLITLALLIMCLLIKNRIHLLTFGPLFFFVCILPRASIIPSCELLVDYKTYLGSVGIFFSIALCAVYVLEYSKMHYEKYLYAFIGLLFCCILSLAFGTYTRNLVWSSEKAFWLDIIQKAPGKARGHNNYGTVQQDMGDHAGSCASFERAIELDSKYPDPWTNLSISHKMLGNLDQAIACVEKALAINPHQPEGHLNYGLYNYEKKNYPVAEKAFLQAILLRPHYGKAWQNLAIVRIVTGNREGALEAAKYAATKSDYSNQQSFAIWAKSAMELKNYDEAIAAYTQMLKLNPHSMDITVQLAQCYIFIKDYANSYKLYTQITNSVTDNPFIWFNMGECAMYLEQYRNAIPAFENTLKIVKDMVKAELRLAQCYEKLGKVEQAAEICNKIIAGYGPKDITEQAQKILRSLK